MKKHIGGFFELELPRNGVPFHANALALSTGRACISLLLQKLQPKKVWMPFYTCDATFDPFRLQNIPVEYYAIDADFNPVEVPELQDGEYFFYTNYFGLGRKNVDALRTKIGPRLIVDATHDFFHKGYPANWSFTSARKYFGVPDGAYLYAPVPIPKSFERFTDYSLDHSINRLKGEQEVAYQQFVQYERRLNSDVKAISVLSESLLSQVDYAYAAQQRRNNFAFWAQALDKFNTLKVECGPEDVPFCYPFLPEQPIERAKLHGNGFYIPQYWPDVVQRKQAGFETERRYSLELLPLMIDHRYTPDDLSGALELILG